MAESAIEGGSPGKTTGYSSSIELSRTAAVSSRYLALRKRPPSSNDEALPPARRARPAARGRKIQPPRKLLRGSRLLLLQRLEDAPRLDGQLRRRHETGGEDGRRPDGRKELRKHVFRAAAEDGAVAEKLVRPGGRTREDAARNCENVPPEIGGQARRDERSAPASKQYGLNSEPTDELYRPLAQSSSGGNLLIRTTSDPMSIARRIREAIYEIDPETAVTDAQTLEHVRSESMASPRLTAILLALFAGLALVITAAGIAGVMALSVSQRTHELGLRMALGATPARVLRMVMGQGMWLVLIGLGLGLVGALALTQLMSALLFAVQPTDPVTSSQCRLCLWAWQSDFVLYASRRVTPIDPNDGAQKRLGN